MENPEAQVNINPDQTKKDYGPSGYRLGYPHFRTLCIGVPWSGRPLPPELVMAFKACTPPMNTNTLYFEAKGMNIADARNRFAEVSIEHGAKYVFFWDEDVLLPPQALRELMFVAENYDKIGVIGGIYCLKTDRPEPMVFRGVAKGPYWDWKIGEVFEVTGISMGCTLIRTEVFKDIEKPWFRTVDDCTSFLDHVPFGEVWTEDLYFCKKVIEAKKWKIYAHGQLLCPHVDIRTGKRYVLPPDSKPMRAINGYDSKKKILDLGCGLNKLKCNEGKVITVDIRDDVEADYRCDFRRLPFGPNEFDAVHSSHSLEHIRRKEVNETLDEWIRVLKPDGLLQITVPNIEWAAKKILANDYTKIKGVDVDCIDVLYGQEDRQEVEPDFHKTGFTPKILNDLLKKRGFKRIDTECIDYHIVCRAWRIPPAKPNGNHSNGKKAIKRR